MTQTSLFTEDEQLEEGPLEKHTFINFETAAEFAKDRREKSNFKDHVRIHPPSGGIYTVEVKVK
jgi:hypothetical protein